MSPATSTTPPPDLLARLREDGLRIDDGDAGPTATTTGDLQAELEAAREAAGLHWAHGRAALEVTGDDRVSYLQRMLTQELLSAGVGDLRRSLLLDQKGRIVADLDLGFQDGRILGVTARETVGQVIEVLQRYALRSDVHLEDLRPTHVVLRLLGPSAVSVLQSAGAEAPAGTDVAALRLADVTFRVTRSSRAVPSGLELIVDADAAASLWSALMEAGRAAGLRPVGTAAAEVLRLEAGIPAHGAELTESEFPQEARLDAAVDFDKGCYLGQETVARIHYRGKVNRLLSGLESEAAMEPGTGLVAEGREVGTVTSAAPLPTGDWLGLGYVRVEHAEPGTRLGLATEGEGPAAEAGSARVRDVAWWGLSDKPAADTASES